MNERHGDVINMIHRLRNASRHDDSRSHKAKKAEQYRCLRKKQPSHNIPIYADMLFSLQNASRNAYHYKSVYTTMVFFVRRHR